MGDNMDNLMTNTNHSNTITNNTDNTVSSDDKINSELSIYSLSSPFHDALQSTHRLFVFNNHSLHLQQRWNNDGKGGTSIGFGASVYNCSIVLADYLEKNPFLIRGRIGLELGCGPGLVSIVASVMGASAVLATDGDHSSVDLADTNIRGNVPSNKIAAHKLYWGNESDIADVQQRLHTMCGKSLVDTILLADVAALPYAAAYGSLVNTVKALLRPGGTVLLAYQRRHASEDDFFQIFRQSFDVVRLDSEAIHDDFRSLPIAIFTATPILRFEQIPDVMERITSPQRRQPLDLHRAFFPRKLSCSARSCIEGGSDGESKCIFADLGVGASPSQRISRAKQRVFPALITRRMYLREMRDSDAPEYLQIRRELARDPMVLDIWGGRSINIDDSEGALNVEDTGRGQGGLREALKRIHENTTDRNALKGIRWALTLRNSAEDTSSSELGVCFSDVLSSNEQMIGSIGFWRIDASSYMGEIGYELHPDYWGNSLMTEALQAVTDYGFREIGLHSIEANIDPRNVGSARVLEKTGFTRQALFIAHYYHEGKFYDSAIYRLINPFWT